MIYTSIALLLICLYLAWRLIRKEKLLRAAQAEVRRYREPNGWHFKDAPDSAPGPASWAADNDRKHGVIKLPGVFDTHMVVLLQYAAEFCRALNLAYQMGRRAAGK